MNFYLRLLTVQSVKELIRYKSFFLLIFILIAADRILHRYVEVDGVRFSMSDTLRLGPEAAEYVFNTFPRLAAAWIFDYRAVLLLVGMFLLKQLISLWPSSDMRRMHRLERTGFGILKALLSLRLQQVAWDAIAVGSVCLLTGLWIVLWFAVCRTLWQWHASPAWVPVLGMLVAAIGPLVMAGFSYSSKIAVISGGRFIEKLKLFYQWITDRRLLVISWLFFAARIVVEFIFVAAIPAYAILTMDSFVARIAIASLSATLMYSYLKMATFKFFLHAYRRYPLVQAEYAVYYQKFEQPASSNGSQTV